MLNTITNAFSMTYVYWHDLFDAVHNWKITERVHLQEVENEICQLNYSQTAERWQDQCIRVPFKVSSRTLLPGYLNLAACS